MTSGTLPQEYVELESFIYLTCGEDKISGSVVGALGPKMRMSDVSQNQISGHLSPDYWGMMDNLIYLSIRNNKISGTLGTQNRNAEVVLFLFMSTLLSGSLPTDFGKLTSLTYLLARDTVISGSCQPYVHCCLDVVCLYLVVCRKFATIICRTYGTSAARFVQGGRRIFSVAWQSIRRASVCSDKQLCDSIPTCLWEQVRWTLRVQ